MPKGVRNSLSTAQEYGLYIIRSSYKSNARRKGLVFELTNDEINEMVQSPCTYCGQEPEPRRNFKHISDLRIQQAMEGQVYYANGIDRIDSNLGYTKDNCCACCSDCNTSKSNMALGTWLNLVERIYKHQHSRD